RWTQIASCTGSVGRLGRRSGEVVVGSLLRDVPPPRPARDPRHSSAVPPPHNMGRGTGGEANATGGLASPSQNQSRHRTAEPWWKCSSLQLLNPRRDRRPHLRHGPLCVICVQICVICVPPP